MFSYLSVVPPKVCGVVGCLWAKKRRWRHDSCYYCYYDSYLFIHVSFHSSIHLCLLAYTARLYETSFYHYYYYSDNSDFTKEYSKSCTIGSTWREPSYFSSYLLKFVFHSFKLDLYVWYNWRVRICSCFLENCFASTCETVKLRIQ